MFQFFDLIFVSVPINNLSNIDELLALSVLNENILLKFQQLNGFMILDDIKDENIEETKYNFQLRYCANY